MFHNRCCERVCAAEHAPRSPFRVLERRRGLAEIVERGARVLVERVCVNRPPLSYATSLKHLKRYAEAKSLLRKTVPVARRTLGAEHDYTLNLRDIYGRCLYRDPGASRDDVAEAIEIMDDVQRRARRVFGPGHPNWNTLPQELTAAREKLATFDT